MFDSFDYSSTNVISSYERRSASHQKRRQNNTNTNTNPYTSYLNDIHSYNRQTLNQSLHKYNTTQMDYDEDEDENEEEDDDDGDVDDNHDDDQGETIKVSRI